ncbi:MAG TPA: hypothetical protein PLN45_00840, partial [Exilispira sp.]|nr:hypothetical protein [Exilispira sp.]
MKKLSPLLIISAILIVSLFLFGQSNVKGPIVDQVLVDVRMQEDVGMKDTAEGKQMFSSTASRVMFLKHCQIVLNKNWMFTRFLQGHGLLISTHILM